MDLSTIVDRVQNDILNDSSGNTWGDAEIKSWVNIGYFDLVNAVEKVNEDYYETTTTGNLVADQQEYSLPADFKRMVRVEIKYNSADSNRGLCLRVRKEEVRTSLEPSTMGVAVTRNAGYYLTGGLSSTASLGFIPIPDEAVTDGYKLWYIPNQDELSDDDDSPQLPTEYHRLLILYAGAKCLQKGDPGNANAKQYLAEYELMRERMIQNLQPRSQDSPKKVVETQLSSEFGIL